MTGEIIILIEMILLYLASLRVAYLWGCSSERDLIRRRLRECSVLQIDNDYFRVTRE